MPDDQNAITEADWANVDKAIEHRWNAKEAFRNNPVGMAAGIEQEKASTRAQYGYVAPTPLTSTQKLEQSFGINRDPSAYRIAPTPGLLDLPDANRAVVHGSLKEVGAKLGVHPAGGGDTLLSEIAGASAPLKDLNDKQRGEWFFNQERLCERVFHGPEGYEKAKAIAGELLRGIGTPFGTDLSNSRSIMVNPTILTILVNHSKTLAALKKA